MKKKHSKKQFYSSALLLCFSLLFSGVSFSQQTDFVVPQNIPPFNLLLSDGTTSFNAGNLEKNKAVMIVYFDPDCGHCIHFTKTIIKNIKHFGNTQIVMIAGTSDMTAIKKFVSDNALNDYPQIKVGTEGIYHATQKFYQVRLTPFTALYNRNGTLITYYREVPDINDLLIKLQK